MNELSKFSDEFIYYYQKTQFDGRRAVKDNRDFVMRLAGDYYQLAKGHVFQSDFKQFFFYLSQQHSQFVDEMTFKQEAQSWRSRRQQREAADRPPEEFMLYMSLYGVLAWRHHVENYAPNDSIFKQIDNYTTLLEGARSLWGEYANLDIEQCHKKFFRQLTAMGATTEDLKTMETLYQKAYDDMMNRVNINTEQTTKKIGKEMPF